MARNGAIHRLGVGSPTSRLLAAAWILLLGLIVSGCDGPETVHPSEIHDAMLEAGTVAFTYEWQASHSGQRGAFTGVLDFGREAGRISGLATDQEPFEVLFLAVTSTGEVKEVMPGR